MKQFNTKLYEGLKQRLGDVKVDIVNGEIINLMPQEGKEKQFMVVDEGKDRIVSLNLTLDEAINLCKKNEFWSVGNMYNLFDHHDCKNGEDNGCHICELIYNIK